MAKLCHICVAPKAHRQGANKQRVKTMAKQAQVANTANTATPPAPILGKYAGVAAKLGNNAHTFKYSTVALYAGIAPKGSTSVMAIVFALVQANPGITGNALVALMQARQWGPHNGTKYTKGGVVCAMWCAGYVVGAAGNKHKHLTTVAPK